MPTEQDSAQVDTLSIEQKFLVYEAFRKRIVDEDTLIHDRTSWFIWSEALFLATWAAVYSKALPVMHSSSPVSSFGVANVVMIMCVFVGWVVAFATIATIWAAHQEISSAKRQYASAYPDTYKDAGIPRVTGRSSSHLLGHMFPFGMPALFILFLPLLIWPSIIST